MYRRVSILLRKHFVSVLILCASIVIPFSSVKAADPAKGKATFQTNCASCHNVHKKLTGPALAGVEDRWPDKKLLHQWIHNSASVLASGDKYANNLFNEYNKTAMTAFPQLSNEDIDDILAYIKVEGSKGPATGNPKTEGQPEGGAEKGNDNSLLFGIITLILAVVALILMQINSNLNKLAGDKEGVPTPDPVPFYKNKAYLALIILVLFMVGGYFTINGAIGLGRQKDYMPEQPIFYSHKVHAGINQINCLYCHAGAEKSKHAMIPSENICMNCHKAIKEYSGTYELVNAEGKKIDGTAEIAKLYDYVGWDPNAGKYTKPGRPIEWTKIHNLPDHVYFNHSQHVVAGQQQCQTCHGAITEMDEVHQFADLSMGWCINCHRTTKVQFADNNYYSIFEKLHQDIKDKKIDSVTVEMVGGTECQKCHY